MPQSDVRLTPALWREEERIYCSSTHKNTFQQLEETLIFVFSLCKNASENIEYNLDWNLYKYSIINCMTVVNTNQTWQPHKGRQKTLQNLTANFIPRVVFNRHTLRNKYKSFHWGITLSKGTRPFSELGDNLLPPNRVPRTKYVPRSCCVNNSKSRNSRRQYF